MAVSIALSDGGSIVAWQTPDGVSFQLFDPKHEPLGGPTVVENGASAWLSATPIANGGFSIIWDASATAAPQAQDYDANGAAVGSVYTLTATPPSAALASSSRENPDPSGSGPWTALLPNGDTVTVTNSNGSGGNPPSLTMQQDDPAGNPVGSAYVHGIQGLPGLGHVEIAAMANGGYAVSFIDESNFGAASYVDLFAADGTHLSGEQVTATGFQLIGSQAVAALADGGFAVSWTAAEYNTSDMSNPAPYAVFGEEFGADGSVAVAAQMLGVLPQTYTPPVIDAYANGSYTISWTAGGIPQSQNFTEHGTPLSPDSNDSLVTPAVAYTLPNGPHDVTMVGDTAQTVTGNNLGDTITANDYASTLIGGSGNDTLIAGHGADVMTGGGGADVFSFPYLPWNAGSITDFVPGTDKLDLSALLLATGYGGSDPVADGWVNFQSDGQGDTRVYFNSHSSSDPWPTLITTLDHVSPSGLTAANTLGTAGSSSGGGGSGGTGETLTANDTAGQQLTGTPYNDTFYAGHNSVVMTGDGGADTFVFNALPWNAGAITDFNTASDVLDLRGIFSAIGYHGSNPVADGYLNFASDGAGDTKIYVDPQGPSTQIPILVTTLDHVSPSAIHSGDYLFA